MDEIFKLILMARVYDIVKETPLDFAPNLSKKLSNRILLKREDLQSVFSFKIRGAYNKIVNLSDKEKKCGVIAASAGNHAQGVALSSKVLGIKATIVMPETTPKIKIDAVKRHGAEVVLKGDNYSEAYEHCKTLINKLNLTYIPPFDDEFVIAGQGTIGHEIIRQASKDDVYAVFVPIGGGGLIAGIATFIKNIYPQIKIIGVEPIESNAMYLSIKNNKKVVLDRVGIFADGVAVKEVGDLTFEKTKQYVDDIILVSVDEIASAIKDIYYDTRNIVEPAGALAVAGIKKYISQHNITSKTFIAINSGANMNFDRLSYVAERAVIGEKQEGLYAVRIPEKPGEFKKFCQRVIQDKNVSEFHYRLSSRNEAYILVGLTMDYEKENQEILERMRKEGYYAMDVTHNELIKDHIRYMIGGKCPIVENEIFYDFKFPEKAGALMRFLSNMKEQWNITTFHYRRHGGEFGRVFIGFEIPQNERAEFEVFLNKIGYDYTHQTTNIACRLFL
ncbi:threonine ammonia-lyase, biosynthetic [Hippea jasoniae]|uniref:threonine ammonia-lyase, biosynthetic n=1 Tax=Hippea jasoniae TaxID=944479 RepID=UPI0005545506|nr:threonine ammonia-lyase, biosynthetic [Hippea jasoniae]